MEAVVNAMKNNAYNNQQDSLPEIEFSAGQKHNRKKLNIPRSPELNNNYAKEFSRSSSKKLSSALKVRKQYSTPSSVVTFNEGEEQFSKVRTGDIKMVRILKRLLKINDTTAAILGITGLFFSVIEYEIFYDDTTKERYTETPDCIILRSFVSITTAVVVVLLILHSILGYKLYLQKREKKTFAEIEKTYFSSNNFKQLILEIIVIGIHCPPNFDQVYKIEQLGATLYYSLDGILMVWMLLRFYLVFRLFAQYSKWTNELAEKCCEPEGCEANTSFAMKAVLKEKPFTTLLFLMMTSAIIFGLAVRHFERPYYYDYSPTELGFQDYSYIWNGMWLIMITMMTGSLIFINK